MGAGAGSLLFLSADWLAASSPRPKKQERFGGSLLIPLRLTGGLCAVRALTATSRCLRFQTSPQASQTQAGSQRRERSGTAPGARPSGRFSVRMALQEMVGLWASDVEAA